MIEQIINIKPLSVNEAWQGKRFKTAKYKAFEKEMILTLKAGICPKENIAIYLKFGFSSKLSDIDNPIKMVLDIAQKKYGFNDRDIVELSVTKNVVKKGEEFITLIIYEKDIH
jgi:Holliday junction resolvase RusA-like endonuclease